MGCGKLPEDTWKPLLWLNIWCYSRLRLPLPIFCGGSSAHVYKHGLRFSDRNLPASASENLTLEWKWVTQQNSSGEFISCCCSECCFQNSPTLFLSAWTCSDDLFNGFQWTPNFAEWRFEETTLHMISTSKSKLQLGCKKLKASGVMSWGPPSELKIK